MAPLHRVLRLLRPYRRYLAQALLNSLLMTAMALPGPYITKLLLDDAYPRGDFGLLHFLLLAAAGFSLLLGAVQALSGLFGRQLGLAMSLDLQTRLYRHVQALDFSFFDRHETGEVLSRFDDLEASTSGVIGIVDTIVINSLQLLVFPAVLIGIHPMLALMSLLVLPFDGLLAIAAGHFGRRYARRIAEASASLSAKTVESIAGIRTIQSLGAEGLFLARIRRRFEDLARLQVRASAIDGVVGFAVTGVRTAGVTAYGWYGWTQVLRGDMTPGTFLAFSAYAGLLYGPVQQLISLWPEVQVVRVHVERFLEVYERKPLVASGPTPTQSARLRGAICFEGVVFGYGAERVLRGVDLQIPAGATVALTGRSGAGKSTLVKLIPRFYDPQAGCVRLDGLDVRRWDLPALRRQVGFALQGGCLFQGTVRDNLTLGAPVAQGDVEGAARRACIHDQIEAMAAGYDTVLGEGGAGLSAGQQQRLALARVLLQDTSILILDEPTSALDEQTEAEVRAALTRACRDRTAVIIAHRPQTIALADHVIELVDGRARWSEAERAEAERAEAERAEVLAA